MLETQTPQHWPLVAGEDLLIADDTLHALLGYSAGLQTWLSASPALHDLLSEHDLHDLRNAAGLGQAETTGLIAGTYTLPYGPRVAHLRRVNGLIMLHLIPVPPSSRERTDPMMALNMLLRGLEGASSQDLPRLTCNNLRAFLGARQTTLALLHPTGTQILYSNARQPQVISPDTHAALLNAQGAAHVLHSDPKILSEQPITLLQQITLPTRTATTPSMPTLAISTPRGNHGRFCFFSGTFLRAPLSFEITATLQSFARITGYILAQTYPHNPGIQIGSGQTEETED